LIRRQRTGESAPLANPAKIRPAVDKPATRDSTPCASLPRVVIYNQWGGKGMKQIFSAAVLTLAATAAQA
jgi:hypothetical protein